MVSTQAVPYAATVTSKAFWVVACSTLQLPTGRSKLLHNPCPGQQHSDQRLPTSHCTSSATGSEDTCTSDISLVLQWSLLPMSRICALLFTESCLSPLLEPLSTILEIKVMWCGKERKVYSQISITSWNFIWRGGKRKLLSSDLSFWGWVIEFRI